MKVYLRVAAMTVLLLSFASAVAAQVSIGITIGPPPPPHVVRVLPPRPGPQFVWVEGYWYPVGHHYKWHQGYWTLPPYPAARWVMPRHDGERYYVGYWEGERGRIVHDHRWDRDKKHRDYREERHDRGHGRDRDRDRD